MDETLVTLIAAMIAAGASSATLVLRARSEKRAELRTINRKSLEPLIEELGDALHKLVACSVLLVKDQDTNNRHYWLRLIAEARTTLRKLRPRVRYHLWGLDDGLKELIILPDKLMGERSHNQDVILRAASMLRQSLDQSIRRCYQFGRHPSWIERRQVKFRANRLRRAWHGLDDVLEHADFFDSAQQQQVRNQYDKMYATVVHREGQEFIAKTKDGSTFRIKVANRSGKGSRTQLQPGVIVKLYQRPGEDFFRYRFVGG